MFRRPVTICSVMVLLLALLVPALPSHAQSSCFRETGQCLDSAFVAYWLKNGDLPVFGFPIRPAADEPNADTKRVHPAQWMERNRFEAHPENAAPYHVLLGRLGDERLRQMGRDWSTFPKADPSVPHFFAATGHAVAAVFWDYWRGHGLDLGDPGMSERESLALFGYPLSEPAMETNMAGDTVLTQWFERARFEYHPDKPAEFQVLLGLLGYEVVEGRARRVITRSAVGHPAVAGSWVVWGDRRHNANDQMITLYGYDLNTGRELPLAAEPAHRSNPVSDGRTVAWLEWLPGSRQRIMAYDLLEHRMFTVLEVPNSGRLGDLALDNGVLFYTDSVESHHGIFARSLAGGPERQIADHLGHNLVAADGVLLWTYTPPAPRGSPQPSTIYLQQLDRDGPPTMINLGQLQPSGYGISGNYVVWARYGEPVHLQHRWTGEEHVISSSDSGTIFRPVIQGDDVVWAAAPGPESPRGSTVAYRISTGNTTRLANGEETGLLTWGIANGRRLVYGVPRESGLQQLIAVPLP